jgi:hypothetical protein
MAKHILDQVRADGIIYFLLNMRGCLAHCANQKRLADNAKDPIRQAAISQYVDALFEAGDIR